MKSWKQAYWLTKFEMKQGKVRGLYLVGLLFISLFLLVPIIPDYLNEDSLGLDFAFIFIFTIVTQWVRPSYSQAKKVSGSLWAAHILIFLNQLPIAKEVIIKYRFLSYIITSVPFQMVFLTALYVFTPVLQTTMTPVTYCIFSLLWLSFTFCLGTSTVEAEAGYDSVLTILLSLFIVGPLVILPVIILFYQIFDQGIVRWTIYVSETYPVLTISVSLILAVAGVNFWMYRMKRRMKRVDYL